MNITSFSGYGYAAPSKPVSPPKFQSTALAEAPTETSYKLDFEWLLNDRDEVEKKFLLENSGGIIRNFKLSKIHNGYRLAVSDTWPDPDGKVKILEACFDLNGTYLPKKSKFTEYQDGQPLDNIRDHGVPERLDNMMTWANLNSSMIRAK